MFLSRSLVKIQNRGDPLWPRGSVVDLRPPWLELIVNPENTAETDTKGDGWWWCYSQWSFMKGVCPCPFLKVKAACLERREITGSNPTLTFKFRRDKNVSSLITRNDCILWGASVTERARISNPVSGVQWHLIHLTILCSSGSVYPVCGQ